MVDIEQLSAKLLRPAQRLDPNDIHRIANAILRDGAPVMARSLGTDD